jgi:hypothetical protein
MRLKPQTRFLLRGSALLVSSLVLWWFVLRGPMLTLLRAGVELLGGEVAGETASGDWTMRVSLEGVIPANGQRAAQEVHSVEFDIAHADINAFTFSLPVYWAIMLAIPGLRRSVRPLVIGTAIVAALELALMFAYLNIVAHTTAGQLGVPQGGGVKWLLHFGEYLVVTVIPYAAPFLIALGLHRDLRGQIFKGAGS